MLRAKEQEFVDKGLLEQTYLDMPLSARMRQSRETGDFWVSYAARKSWAFDGIYWRSIDERFFGRNEGDFMERLKLLPPDQTAGMEDLVRRKMKEREEATLVDWYEEGPDSTQLPPDILRLDLEEASTVVEHTTSTAAEEVGGRIEGLALEDVARSP